MIAFRFAVEIVVETARDAERVARAVRAMPDGSLPRHDELEREARAVASGARPGGFKLTLSYVEALALADGFDRIASKARMPGIDVHEERQAAEYLRRACR